MVDQKSGRSDAISVHELKDRLDKGEKITILDVREKSEFQICNIGGILIPLRQLPEKMSELDAEGETVVICHSGNRSLMAVRFLQSAGFQNVKNLTGGIDAWARFIDPAMRRY
ncbi:MAG TPA: rhodanese-like domain-containing protein [Candidatus Kryptonia bacterium]